MCICVHNVVAHTVDVGIFDRSFVRSMFLNENRDGETQYEIEITAIYGHLNRNAMPKWIEPSNHNVLFIFVRVMSILVEYIYVFLLFCMGESHQIALEAKPTINCCVDDLNRIRFYESRKA